jgi:hypothetical protein
MSEKNLLWYNEKNLSKLVVAGMSVAITPNIKGNSWLLTCIELGITNYDLECSDVGTAKDKATKFVVRKVEGKIRHLDIIKKILISKLKRD